jgi:hypothetical protein
VDQLKNISAQAVFEIGTAEEIRTILVDMDRDTRNPDILILMPQMSLVWACKPS